MLPGMDGTGLLFASFVSALGSRVKPIVMAYPSTESLDYTQLESFARQHLPAVEPFVLLGESFSGPVAISIAADPPPNLAGLILCCSFAKNPRPRLNVFRAFTRLMPGLRSSMFAAPLLLGTWASSVLKQQLHSALRNVQVNVFRTRLRAILDVDVCEKLRRIHVPILYLRATRDRLVPEQASQLIASLAPRTRLMNIEGPHMLLQAAPTAAADAVAEFSSEAARP